jgi:hypothetical protein
MTMATRTRQLCGFLIVGLLGLTPSAFGAVDGGSLLERVQARARELHLAEDRQWRRLLHADSPSAFSSAESTTSQIDSASFFLSAKGKTDPSAELDATIKAFFTSDLDQRAEAEIAQCRFPARWLWLKSKFLDHVDWPEANCPAYGEFRARVAAKSVSLVFSSYYVNNPASGFGHTLLRLNKSAVPEQDRRHELLDYGVNYAAQPNTNNPLLYTFNGLFGFFPGVFTAVPYFFKVREYNDFESRDLWSYNLNLSPAAIELVVAQIWELAPTSADYYYLTENCAYHMLSILEAADPALDLKSRLKTWVIPGDTVKVVNETPGLVRGIQYRPSARVVYHSAKTQLTGDEAAVFDQLLRSRDPAKLETLPSTSSRARVIEAAFTYLDYAHFNDLTRPTPEKSFKDRLLLARSRLPETTVLTDPPVPWNEAPHLAHSSRRIGFGVRADKSFLLQYRFALHDLTDALEGYPDHAEIIFFDLGARAGGEAMGASLERAVLFDVVSLAPSEPEFPRVSWRFRLGWDRSHLQACRDCSSAQVAGGFGQTYELTRNHSLTGHLHLQSEWLEGRAYGLTGPLITARSIWSSSLISVLDLGYHFSLGRPDEAQAYGRLQLQKTFSESRRWAVAVQAEQYVPKAQDPETSLEMKLFAFY